MPPRTVFESMSQLREDARARGMPGLALVYSWSLVRLTTEEVAAKLKAFLAKKE